MLGVGIKAVFGGLAALFYLFGAWTMLAGATTSPGFAPGAAVSYLVTAAGAAITTFVTTQLGIVIATNADKQDGGSVKDRLDQYSEGNNSWVNWVTIAVLLLDTAILIGTGLVFVYVWARPASIAVPVGSPALTVAPDYIDLQAKAFVALVLAGAAGVGIAAKR